MPTTGLSAFLAQSERLPGRIRPSATYRLWNMGGNALISSIPNSHRAPQSIRYHLPLANGNGVDSDACHF